MKNCNFAWTSKKNAVISPMKSYMGRLTLNELSNIIGSLKLASLHYQSLGFD